MGKRELNYYFDFLWAMTEREIKTRYKRTALGLIWSLLSPLLQALIISFVISLFVKIPNYLLFIISGLLPWSFFSNSIKKATTSITAERRLLHKAKFPVEIIPTSIVLADFINLVLLLMLLSIFLLITKTSSVSNLLIVIPALFWLFVLAEGISLLTSSLQVKYRDVDYILGTFMVLGFYISPIIYTISFIPTKIQSIFFLNPLASIIELIHFGTLNNGFLNLRLISINLLITIVIIFCGIIVFKKMRHKFVDWL